MKRIHKKRARAELEKRALEQLRQTRKALDDKCPELLGNMREIILEASDGGGGAKSDGSALHESAEIEIDQKKNIETVMKFIDGQEHSADFKKALYKILN